MTTDPVAVVALLALGLAALAFMMALVAVLRPRIWEEHYHTHLTDAELEEAQKIADAPPPVDDTEEANWWKKGGKPPEEES